MTIEEMHEMAAERGGKCLSEKYVNSRNKLTWQCKKGHVWEAQLSSVKHNGRWCPYCAGTMKLTIKEMHRVAKNKGGKCLSDKYINSATKLKWQCREGHVWEATPNNVKRKSWCPACYKLNHKK